VEKVESYEIVPAAQEAYRTRTARQDLLVLVPVLTLVIGQVTSLWGVLLDGTSASSWLLAVTAATLACSFTVIVSAALGELIRANLR
jgi:hypothetical protein